MPAPPLPADIVQDRKAASRELNLALWAHNRSPSTISIGESTHAPALTIWMDVPCPKGMEPAQQLAQTRRFLRHHGVVGKAEFCADTYPRQALTFPTAADVWRLSAVIVEQLSAPNAARYRLRRAAAGVGVEWYSSARYPTLHSPVIRPEDLSVRAARCLYRALAHPSVATAVEREDEDAVEVLLDELTVELSRATGADFLLYQTDDGTIRFSGCTPEAANRLADALAQHTRRLRAALAVALDFESAS
ncbi:hypothetical protein [Streptomyces xanthochromogenes]|uniref:Uncharacterized protein n=1 Tax=Streptomyces xanthochromogenes TaxID=67384 RepID=A0ABQ3B009_9ACTN|nr:hypothetical protein [Streptomyces xanthochromogenes]GGY70613.1 hypothetical protein GCM10010326_76030 [Streptomyces xanthochromogenes]